MLSNRFQQQMPQKEENNYFSSMVFPRCQYELLQSQEKKELIATYLRYALASAQKSTSAFLHPSDITDRNSQ
jgi:hypothetical protein